MLKKYLVVLAIISFHGYGQSKSESESFEKILNLRKKSNNRNLNISERLEFAEEALKFSIEIEMDTSIISDYSNISFLHLSTGDYKKYRNYSNKALFLGKKIEDTTAIASAYFNIGQSFYAEYRNDSAYYYFSKSVKFYDHLNDFERKAKLLLNLADIQDTEQDFIGSEENAIAALKLYETLPRTEKNLDRTYMLNNLLGIVSMKLGYNEKSLEFHKEAETVAEAMQEGFYNKIFSINNVAYVYRKQGNYEKALELYSDLIKIKKQYSQYDATFYPLLLTNSAYTKLLAGHTDFSNMESSFQEAYRISDSLDDPITKLAVSIDRSKFYLQQKQQDSSLKYATIAYDLSKETSSNEILLDALKVLSELKQGEDGKAYLKEHIALSDSLLNVERSVRNKFARIEFETDKISEENERMTIQRRWLFIVSIVLLVTLFLAYVVIYQRNKNRKLRLEKDQQKANEEIYNLMLSQQDKVEEARVNEKNRISREIHEGILGRLFGTRINLENANVLAGVDAVKSRFGYINELKILEDDIRGVSHDLSSDFVSGSGFMTIVYELIKKQAKAYQLNQNFNYDDDISWEHVNNKTKINIYRIIQESLQNIYKHAEATEVTVGFESKNDDICVTIVDDGKGFDHNKSKKGIGLKNINERVKELEGSVIFDSQKGRGTNVVILVPYKN